MVSSLTFFTCVTALVANVEVELELDDADDAMFVLALPVCVDIVTVMIILDYFGHLFCPNDCYCRRYCCYYFTWSLFEIS